MACRSMCWQTVEGLALALFGLLYYTNRKEAETVRSMLWFSIWLLNAEYGMSKVNGGREHAEKASTMQVRGLREVPLSMEVP